MQGVRLVFSKNGSPIQEYLCALGVFGHNEKGADSCPNAVTVDEEELIQAL